MDDMHYVGDLALIGPLKKLITVLVVYASGPRRALSA